MINIRANFPL